MNPLPQPQSDTLTLYYREGTSDKVYQAAIEPAGDGLYAVTFAYGRRGGTLNTGRKTNRPVSYGEAKSIFDRLVRAKLAKGYTPGADGTPYVGGNGDQQPSGYRPQLLNPIDATEVQRLLQDNVHVAQEKFDGRRLLLRKAGAAIDGINRKGLVVGLPEPVFQAFRRFPGDCVLDGESVGDVFHAFDLLIHDGQDIRTRQYQNRLTALINLLASVQQRAIRFTETAFTPEQKMRLHARLQVAGKEGIVFKRWDAPYTPGRPNSGGPQLKHKFYATLSAVVSRINAQRSVEIRLCGKDGWHPAGNVTIPPNHRIPAIGCVIEVRYLYATDAGILYQPTYLGERADVEQHECVRAQLKFKPAAEEAEAA
ncbi:MAG TPA: WGR domain-containing protein [Verrucomicrobiota bacterium]|nr:WGR domain-containing protein [Verrucomicrobiota bacterium]HQB17586.1 WGR domain-containing protein [Verrucomicrobiota bacterium]